MATFSTTVFTPLALATHLLPAADDTYDLGQSSDIGPLLAWRQLVAVRIRAGDAVNQQILLATSGATLRGNFNFTDGIGIATVTGAGNFIGTLLSPFNTGYFNTEFQIPAISTFSRGAGIIYITGTGVTMRLNIDDGGAVRQFVPDV